MRWRQQRSLDKIDFLWDSWMYSWRGHTKKRKGRPRRGDP